MKYAPKGITRKLSQRQISEAIRAYVIEHPLKAQTGFPSTEYSGEIAYKINESRRQGSQLTAIVYLKRIDATKGKNDNE